MRVKCTECGEERLGPSPTTIPPFEHTLIAAAYLCGDCLRKIIGEFPYTQEWCDYEDVLDGVAERLVRGEFV